MFTVFEEMPEDVYWRYDDFLVHTGGYDECGVLLPGSSVKIRARYYPVLRRTPKGAWIRYFGPGGQKRRFILTDARKRFACPTKAEALESFIARKRAQHRIYAARQRDATDAEALAVKELLKEQARG